MLHSSSVEYYLNRFITGVYLRKHGQGARPNVKDQIITTILETRLSGIDDHGSGGYFRYS